MTTGRPALGSALLRGLRCRCPQCGLGRVFPRGFRPRRSCERCGWRYERGVGHFLGGNEINLVVTFPVGVAAYLVASQFFGDAIGSPLIAGFTAGCFGVLFSRPSRVLFYALDCWADPLRPEDGADDGGSASVAPGPFPVGSLRLGGPLRFPADGLRDLSAQRDRERRSGPGPLRRA